MPGANMVCSRIANPSRWREAVECTICDTSNRILLLKLSVGRREVALSDLSHQPRKLRAKLQIGFKCRLVEDRDFVTIRFDEPFCL
jgi:hypothetical protein